MTRISVTDVDAFRYYQQSEDMALEDIRRRLLHLDPPSEPMKAGTALHTILERSDGSPLDQAEQDGYTFIFAPDLVVSLPTVREIPGQMELCGVTVSGKVDAASGLTIWDHKLTGQFDAEKYHNAFQWRLYLQIFAARRMVYNIFEGYVRAETPNEYQIRNVHELKFYRYPGMEADNERVVSEYLDFYRRFVEPRAA